MAHFYLIDGLDALGVGSHVVLDGDEGRHAVAVSRVRVGEKLMLGNGRGCVAQVTVESVEKTRLTALIQTIRTDAAPARRVTLIQALAKSDRDERAIEAATELGVDAVMPWSAARSVSVWDASKAIKGRQRWESIVREASKQSLRSFVPDVFPLGGTADIASLCEASNVVVLDPTGDVPLPDVTLEGSRDVYLVVGPEGGLSPEELATLRQAGATVASLGRNILRTSTAGPTALAVLGRQLGRW
jgi:16S rRNA (uracil1498-N3)-methyltransferase